MPTLKCNLSCVGCDRGYGKPGPLSIADLDDFSIIESIVKKIERLDGFVVSGGEPTGYRKIVELLDYCHSLKDAPVDVKTNSFRLLELPLRTVIRNLWSISMYKENEKFIRNNADVFNNLIRSRCVSIVEVGSFENLESLKNEDTGFNPMLCFMPTVIGNSEYIYPCCRAFTFEKKTGSRYSVHMDDFSISSLQEIIESSDMCSLCPRKVGSDRIEK